MSDVYILGIDMLKFGRFPERSVQQLGAEDSKPDGFFANYHRSRLICNFIRLLISAI